jgi:hypothetical protein
VSQAVNWGSNQCIKPQAAERDPGLRHQQMPSNSRQAAVGTSPQGKAVNFSFSAFQRSFAAVIRRIHRSCPPNAAQLQGQNSKATRNRQVKRQGSLVGPDCRRGVIAPIVIVDLNGPLCRLSSSTCANLRSFLSPAGQPQRQIYFPAPPQGLPP